MAGFVGTTWKNAAGRRQQTKFQWNKGDLEKMIGAGAAIALQKAGLEVRKTTQRMMVGGSTPAGRKPRARPQWWKVGEKDGYPVLAYVKKVPHPEKVSSWSPRAFLRNDVQSDFDTRSRSVVIGPSKAPWLNQLHEFGGNVRVYVMHGKTPVRRFGGDDIPKKHQRSVSYRMIDGGGRSRKKRAYAGAYVGIFSNRGGRFFVGVRTVRDRAYMEIGLQVAISQGKIPKQFENTIKFGAGKIRVFKERGFRR